MRDHADRIRDSADLGRAGRGEDLLLGSLAIVPLILGAGTVWLFPSLTALISAAATAWSGALLTFFAGVRRGLTFSEAGGAKPREIASMLWLFGLGVGALWLRAGPLALGLAILGFASVAALDVMAARRLEAPRYFRLFRPTQLAVAIGALCVLIARICAT
jgi:hypothetical protein